MEKQAQMMFDLTKRTKELETQIKKYKDCNVDFLMLSE